MFVSNRMTANPFTLTANATVADASETMRTHKFRRLPIVENGKLVGIITDRDLREVSPSPATTLSIFELNYLLAKMMVKDIMKKDVLTIQANSTIEEAALLMYKNKIGGLVVVDDQDSVIGVITETDIFKTFVDVMGITQGKTTRVTIDVTDKVGILCDITGIFKDLSMNISSLVSYPLEDGSYELVIRAQVNNSDALVEHLSSAGYPVKHITQIS
ncbi:CBS and ACT domain-containing protein [Anaerospora sp.]|jgi:acetoin utilization protein AcuB|uniref:CBS and ACT domain-containing protein n=2 Tax=Anaerospora sp. TaxID=1960278 RepID=UPI002896DA2F|nr:CBS and ACT domain-containing protein [Anaerospora sp.]MDF2929755.1 putative signal transduction protein with domain containing protein [Anaerospora sp.]